MQTVKRRILMVDDDVMLLSAMKRYLDGTGRFEVRTEHTSPKAKAAVAEFHPELIILDVIMPNMDGGDVATMLRDDPRTRDIPVIFLTSMVSQEQVQAQNGLIAGHPFVAKPAKMKELLQRIDDCLDARKTPPG
jgi:CheY-like chemotaxis protein